MDKVPSYLLTNEDSSNILSALSTTFDDVHHEQQPQQHLEQQQQQGHEPLPSPAAASCGPLKPPATVSSNASASAEPTSVKSATDLKDTTNAFYIYRDFSTFEDPDPSIPVTQPGRIPNFPSKMYAILSRPELSDIVSWMPHGRSWKVHKPREFEIKVIPAYFEHSKFSSFIRQANGWGFRRIISKGPDRNSYYHELFLRGMPHLLKLMKRPTSNKKPLVDASSEPEFYKIAEERPLPELKIIKENDTAGSNNNGSSSSNNGIPQPNFIELPQPYSGGHQEILPNKRPMAAPLAPLEAAHSYANTHMEPLRMFDQQSTSNGHYEAAAVQSHSNEVALAPMQARGYLPQSAAPAPVAQHQQHYEHEDHHSYMPTPISQMHSRNYATLPPVSKAQPELIELPDDALSGDSVASMIPSVQDVLSGGVDPLHLLPGGFEEPFDLVHASKFW